jgi:hypothetical protein
VAPGAAFALVGGASEDGPGILRMNHPDLGDYQMRTPPQDGRVAPLFTVEQIRAIHDSRQDRAIAFGQPWTDQFIRLTPQRARVSQLSFRPGRLTRRCVWLHSPPPPGKRPLLPRPGTAR